MRTQTTRQLYAYWNELRAGRLAPRRFEIEPSRIAEILPDTFILERGPTSEHRFRLAGTRICDMMGGELRGRDFYSLWQADDAEMLARDLDDVATRGAACLVAASAKGRHSGRETDLEILILPLVHLRTIADRTLGCITAVDSPPWLGSEPLGLTGLLRRELIWPDGRPHPIVEQMDRQAPFLPQVRHARIVRSERRQFRVYEGGLGRSERDA